MPAIGTVTATRAFSTQSCKTNIKVALSLVIGGILCNAVRTAVGKSISRTMVFTGVRTFAPCLYSWLDSLLVHNCDFPTILCFPVTFLDIHLGRRFLISKYLLPFQSRECPTHLSHSSYEYGGRTHFCTDTILAVVPTSNCNPVNVKTNYICNLNMKRLQNYISIILGLIVFCSLDIFMASSRMVFVKNQKAVNALLGFRSPLLIATPCVFDLGLHSLEPEIATELYEYMYGCTS